ncbi:hypothetical protein QOT17_003115 [Balamuthia mandrillaris]
MNGMHVLRQGALRCGVSVPTRRGWLGANLSVVRDSTSTPFFPSCRSSSLRYNIASSPRRSYSSSTSQEDESKAAPKEAEEQEEQEEANEEDKAIENFQALFKVAPEQSYDDYLRITELERQQLMENVWDTSSEALANAGKEDPVLALGQETMNIGGRSAPLTPLSLNYPHLLFTDPTNFKGPEKELVTNIPTTEQARRLQRYQVDESFGEGPASNHPDFYDGDWYSDFTRSRALRNPKEEEAKRQQLEKYTHFDVNIDTEAPSPDYFRVVEMGRHTTVTKGGRVFSFSAVVIDGNGQGTAGMGRGKGSSPQEALTRAMEDVQKNLITIDRYQGEALAEDIAAKSHRSFVKLFTVPKGMIAPQSSETMTHVFNSFGLTRVFGKTWGRKNKVARMRALFKAIKLAQNPNDISEKLGMHLWKPFKIWRKGGRTWSYD